MVDFGRHFLQAPHVPGLVHALSKPRGLMHALTKPRGAPAI